MHLQNWYSFRKKSAKFAVKGLSLSQSYKTKKQDQEQKNS